MYFTHIDSKPNLQLLELFAPNLLSFGAKELYLMSSLWYVSLGCCAAAPSPTATSKASCRTRIRDVQLTGVAEPPQSLSSKIWQFGYSSFWKIIHHVAESTDRISREISSPYLKYGHSQSEPALQYTLFFVCCVIPRQRRIWCHVATQQAKKHILGASVGPQLLHGRGLCNFWAKINSAGGEVDAGRHVLNTKCVWTHVVISAIAKCRYSTLNVHQFSWFSKSRDQHLWCTGLTSEIWMVTNFKVTHTCLDVLIAVGFLGLDLRPTAGRNGIRRIKDLKEQPDRPTK